MIRTLLIVIAIAVLALGLRRATNTIIRYRRRRTHKPQARFQATTRCVRCGAHLAPGVGRQTADGPVCDTPDCHKACIDKNDQ